MHGESWDLFEQDCVQFGIPVGSTGFKGCAPISPVVLPNGTLLCKAIVKDRLLSVFPDLTFTRVYVKRIVSVPWKKWRAKGAPIYPKSGEPEAYFSEFPVDLVRSGHLSDELFRLRITSEVLMTEGIRWWKRIDVPVSVSDSIPNAPVFQAVVGIGSGWGPIICCKRFKEILEDYTDVLELDEVVIRSP
jgi:hypothetical protein